MNQEEIKSKQNKLVKELIKIAFEAGQEQKSIEINNEHRKNKEEVLSFEEWYEEESPFSVSK